MLKKLHSCAHWKAAESYCTGSVKVVLKSVKSIFYLQKVKRENLIIERILVKSIYYLQRAKRET